MLSEERVVTRAWPTIPLCFSSADPSGSWLSSDPARSPPRSTGARPWQMVKLSPYHRCSNVCMYIYTYILYIIVYIYIYNVLKQWAILWVPHNIPTIPNYIKWAWKPEFLNSGKPQVAKMLPKWHPPKSSNIDQKEVPVVESSRQTILRWWNGSNRRCCCCRFHPCWYTYLPLWKI